MQLWVCRAYASRKFLLSLFSYAWQREILLAILRYTDALF